jgi:hypothetical protein
MCRSYLLTVLQAVAALAVLAAATATALDLCFKKANEWPVQSCDRTRCNNACESSVHMLLTILIMLRFSHAGLHVQGSHVMHYFALQNDVSDCASKRPVHTHVRGSGCLWRLWRYWLHCAFVLPTCFPSCGTAAGIHWSLLLTCTG